MDKFQLIEQTFGSIFSDNLINELAKNGRVISFEEGESVISRNDTVKEVPIILSGTAKIVRTDEKGEEHILFYLNEKEACTATFSICAGSKQSEVDFVLETDAKLLLYPVKLMDHLTKEFPGWRYYVCQNYNLRMKEFLQTMDTVVFMKMDERIFSYLQKASEALQTDMINITHQEIANDLSTSRVVVSRLLKQMENEGKLVLHRNRIELLK
jgi:CRP/FNR family transcriptional regulator